MSKKHKKKNKKRKIKQIQNNTAEAGFNFPIKNKSGEKEMETGLKSVAAENSSNPLATVARAGADYATNKIISQEANSEQDEKMVYIKQDIRRIGIVGGLSLGIIFCFLIIMAKTDFFVPILDRIAGIL